METTTNSINYDNALFPMKVVNYMEPCLEEAARDRMACLCDLFEAADSRGMPDPQVRFRSPGVN